MKWISVILLGFCCGLAQAADVAYTIRATELKARPYSDAVTLARLPQRTRVVVVGRRSSWMQVQAEGSNGWVKMLSLKFNSAESKSSDSGLATLFNVASSGGSGRSVTTGVRGLSEQDLKDAKPNPKALQAMEDFAVDGSEAQKFARSGKLSSQNIRYIPESAIGGKK